MTVSTEEVSKSYKPGTAMAPEAILFQFLDTDDFVVVHVAAVTGGRTTLVPGMDYVIAGDGMARTGTITATAIWPADDSFELTRTTPPLQKAEFPSHQPVSSVDVERQLDRQTLALQEVGAAGERLDLRALTVPVGQVAPAVDLSNGRTNDFLALIGDTVKPAAISQALNGANPIVVTSRALLALLAMPADGQPASLTEDGYQGPFNFISGNLSIEVAADPDHRNYVAPASVPNGSAGAWVRQSADSLKFSQTGEASEIDTVGGKLQQTKNLLDALCRAERIDALSGNPQIDTTAKVNAFLAEHSAVEITDGVFLVDHVGIPSSLLSLRGRSRDTPTFKRVSGATGAMFRAIDPRITFPTIESIYLVGNGEGDETCGFDLTGFSYATFKDCRARLCNEDGWYSKGVITPTNRQMSNNTLINCIGNNNGRDGLRFEGDGPLRNENTANVFIGGEFSGNTGKGIHADVCERTIFSGVICQGNTGRDIYLNSRGCTFDGYIESGSDAVELGPLSYGCNVGVRSSYPLWNTFVDVGMANKVSVLGDIRPERHLFNNPHFANWIGAVPSNMAIIGAPTLASYADAGSPFGASLQVTITGSLQALIFSLNETAANLAGRWATLLLEVDTSDLVDVMETRLYTRDAGSIPNTTNGEYVIETLPKSTSGVFATLAYDVKFTDSPTGSLDLIWYVAYSGVFGSNPIKIRSARVLLGQTRDAGWPQSNPDAAITVTTLDLSAAANGINIHRKMIGRTVGNSTTGKLYFATGTAPTSAWRPTDGTADIAPS